MKKAFKLLFVAMLVVLMLVSVVACDIGGGGGADPTPAPDGSGVDPNAIFTNAGETYSFYSWQYDSASPYSGNDERDQQMRDRISEIESTHGITIEFVPEGSQGAMLASAFQGVPDITGQKEGGLHTMMETYLYQGNPGQCLVPLSDHSDVYDFRNEEKFNVFSQYDLCEYNDKLWFFIPQEIGIHFECGGNALVFNKEIIEAAGSSAAEIYSWVEDGTWTWDKFETLLAATTNPSIGQWGIERGNEALVMWSLANSNGTEFVLKETLASGQIQDSFVISGDKGDRLMRAYDEFIKFADEGWMNTKFYNALDKAPLDHFLGGSVAFFYNGYSTNALKFIAEAEFEYGLVPWPKGPDNAANENKWNSFYPHLNPYCIFRTDGNVKGAVQILCKLYTPIYDKNSEEAQLLYESEIELYTRDDESAKYLDLIEQDGVKTHFRVFMYSQAPVTIASTNARTVQAALFGKGEDDILNAQTTAAKYFAEIANAINTAIYLRSPYSWK